MDTQREEYILLKELGEVAPVLSHSKAILAGGAITALFSGERIRDWDIYFRFSEDRDKAEVAFLREGRLTFSTDLARTYKWGQRQKVFQLIHSQELSGEPEQIFEHYDFTICMAAYDFVNKTFVFHPDFFKHLALRRLVFHHKTLFPICSLLRTIKYQKRGFAVGGIEILKIGLAIQALEINTYADLRRQLMGIDTAFLAELTNQFKEGELAEQSYNIERFLEMMDDYVRKAIPHLQTDGEDPDAALT